MARFLGPTLDEWWSKDMSRVPVACLPVLVCQVYGGNFRDVLPVLVAWRLLCLAAKMYDDVEDGDAQLALPEQINTATSLLFLAQLALGRLSLAGVPTGKVEKLRDRLNQAGLIACNGQYLALSKKNEQIRPGPDGWLEVALAKSGHPFAWAAWAGGVIAGAGEDDLNAIWVYGLHLGVLRQVTDDVRDFWNGEKLEISSNPLSCLPLCYAEWVLQNQERESFVKLLDKANQKDLEALTQLREFVEGLGAKLFANSVAGIQVDQALKALQMMNASQQTILPLWNILEVMTSCLHPHESQKLS